MSTANKTYLSLSPIPSEKEVLGWVEAAVRQLPGSRTLPILLRMTRTETAHILSFTTPRRGTTCTVLNPNAQPVPEEDLAHLFDPLCVLIALAAREADYTATLYRGSVFPQDTYPSGRITSGGWAIARLGATTEGGSGSLSRHEEHAMTKDGQWVYSFDANDPLIDEAATLCWRLVSEHTGKPYEALPETLAEACNDLGEGTPFAINIAFTDGEHPCAPQRYDSRTGTLIGPYPTLWGHLKRFVFRT